jgi:AcrR family transcriptional regulator
VSVSKSGSEDPGSEQSSSPSSRLSLPSPEDFLRVIDAQLKVGDGSTRSLRDPPTRNRKVGRPSSSEATDTRSLILSAALSCFGTYGFDRTTNSQIAETAGVSPPTIYHYFDSKASLFQTVSNMAHRKVFERVAREVERAQDTRGRIAALIGTLTDLFLEEPNLAGFIANYAVEVRRNPEVLRLSPRELLTGPIDYFAEIIRIGQGTNEVNSKVDPVAVAGMALSLLYGVSTFFTVSRDDQLNFAVARNTELLILGNLFT